MRSTAICVLAAVAMASPAFAQTEIAGSLDSMIAAARQEGTLSLVWSDSIMGGSDQVALHEAAFNKLFGTAISFKFAPGIEMARLGNQLFTEMQAGQKASSDIYIGAAAQVVPLLQKDLFVPVPWQRLQPDRITPKEVEEDGKALRFQTALSGVTYNTTLIKTPPEE